MPITEVHRIILQTCRFDFDLRYSCFTAVLYIEIHNAVKCSAIEAVWKAGQCNARYLLDFKEYKNLPNLFLQKNGETAQTFIEKIFFIPLNISRQTALHLNI